MNANVLLAGVPSKMPTLLGVLERDLTAPGRSQATDKAKRRPQQEDMKLRSSSASEG